MHSGTDFDSASKQMRISIISDVQTRPVRKADKLRPTCDVVT